MNAEKQKAVKMLKTARGQVEGIIKMIEDERYCIDISNQILAASAMMKKANLLILKQHINHCLLDAIKEDSGQEKLDEMIDILSKIMNK